jgi:2-polyprenyl-3-methyl-5-hydroxy-6-metoxy-1,4-benzoquinol methylase
MCTAGEIGRLMMDRVALEKQLQERLDATRRWEIELVRDDFKPGMRVLEIGGGSGFQAQVLSSWGCDVSSIDLEGTLVGKSLKYPVSSYDGKRIPFQEQSFDAVFSSNVLEHVPHLSEMLGEISRVVKQDGVIVHILPSTSWRFWSSVTHYVHVARLVYMRLLSPKAVHEEAIRPSSSTPSGRDWGIFIKGLLRNGPHGAYPNEFYELYAFSRRRWCREFIRHGFEITKCFRNELFYSGHGIFSKMSMERRKELSKIFGPAAWIYVMRPMVKGVQEVRDRCP